MSDLISGYPQWAIFTFIIDGLQAVLVGLLVREFKPANVVIGSLVAGVWKVFGYFIAGGILSGFGIGGGSLLLLYLTLFAGVDQYQAGGINLLYFIACAPAALYSHIKNGLVQKDAVKWCVAAGVLTSIAAALAAARMDTGWLRRAFGVFLLYIGAKELFTKRKQSGTEGK